MSYSIIVPKPTQKQLNSLPEEIRDRITEKIFALTDDPRPPGTKKLKGYDNEYRIRVGDYRVRYEIDDSVLVILVVSCRHRKDVYRN
jgi:mRNA interferase RelE/StbE